MFYMKVFLLVHFVIFRVGSNYIPTLIGIEEHIGVLCWQRHRMFIFSTAICGWIYNL